MARFYHDVLMITVGLLAGVFTTTVLSAGGQGKAGRRAEGGQDRGALTIQISNARMVALPYIKHPAGAFSSMSGPAVQVDSSAPDPGVKNADGGPNTHFLGPFFIVKGDVVQVNGVPAHGQFVSRGVWFGNENPPQPQGVAQESLSIDVADRGMLFADGIMLRTAPPAGILLGGTGDFEGMRGTYRVDGAVAPYGTGNLILRFRSSRNPK